MAGSPRSPFPDPTEVDPLQQLLLDPAGRAATRRNKVYLFHELDRLVRRGAGRKLGRFRSNERARFRELAPRFTEVLRSLLRSFPSPSADSAWRAYNAGIAQQLVPSPPFDFLRRPPLTPNVYWDAYDSVISSELQGAVRQLRSMNLDPTSFLRENAVGGPWMYDRKYLTSSVLIHHLMHVLFLSDSTGVHPAQVRRVVEWGGGYGSLARILFRFHPDVEYVILDTPLMMAVQWLFLSTVLGPDRVLLPNTGSETSAAGRVRLQDASSYETEGAPVDLFISTFALSESPPSLIERVEERNWFDAKHLWLAYTPTNPGFPQWKDVESGAVRSGARVVPHPYRKVDRYAWR